MTQAETLRKEAISYAESGYVIIKLRGKIPAVSNWTAAEYIWPDDVPSFLNGWSGNQKNFGVVLSARDLVIDVDPRNFKPGDKPHTRLFQDLKIDVKEIAAVARTGSGGAHIYLKLPPGIRVKETLPEYPGVEFKSKGRQVVGVGSTHPDIKEPYTWAGGLPLREVCVAPDALLNVIRRAAFRATAVRDDIRAGSGAQDADPDTNARYAEWLGIARVAVTGDQGDITTYKAACRGRDMGLSAACVFDHLLKHYNPRCVPPWAPDELRVKVRNAFEYASERPGNALPQNDFTAVETKPETHPLYRGWDRMKDGTLKKTSMNVFNFFIVKDSPFVGALGYDEFNGQVKILSRLPWHEPNMKLPPGGLEWTDTDSIRFRLWMSREKNLDVAVTLIDQAVLDAAHLQILHPVKDFLRELKWDGTSRLETWLIDYAGADDNRFVREASKKFLLQAVARVYTPGCKADHIIVLEGEQGVGKSSIVEILGGSWYGDIVIDPHARDTVDAMRGKWFIELSEMEAIRRTDAQALKAFITRRVDRVRLAYGKRSVDLPRQCVMVGTINPDATSEYLTDTTGNRRMWPIYIKKVNFAGLQSIREQLFAEAVDLVLGGEDTYIVDREVLQLADEEQKKRLNSDPWETAISEYCTDKVFRFVTTKEVWVFALKGSDSALSNVQQRRIARCLKELGFVPHVKRDPDGRVVRGFVHREALRVDKEMEDSLLI